MYNFVVMILCAATGLAIYLRENARISRQVRRFGCVFDIGGPVFLKSIPVFEVDLRSRGAGAPSSLTAKRARILR